MESFLTYICEQSHQAHWFIFLLLLFSGFNLPVSEDLLIISAGIIAGSCIPDHTLRMWLWAYAGACMSAWIAYSIGRVLGPKLYNIAWFRRIITPERIAKLRYYYEKFGIFTFITIRFFPGGFRNGFSMSCGLSKMPFLSFAIRDELAASIQVSVLFYLGYVFGENSELLFNYIKRYNQWALGLLAAIVIGAVGYKWIISKRAPHD